MKKKFLLCAITALLTITPMMTAKAYDKDITIPTTANAVIEGKIKSEIEIGKETSQVNPWLYADIKLDATKSKQHKYNYAELALKRAFGFFNDNKLSLKEGDFYIVLNNGFVINRDNYKDKKVTDMAMTEILNKDFYRGDTIFKLAFLYHDNAVERTTKWALVDTIDLPAGSSHTLTKQYTAGITETAQLKMGQTLGLKLISEIGSSSSVDLKFASAKAMLSLKGEVNATREKAFENNREIKSTFESSTNISYKPCDKDKVILRYQLIDNYKADSKAFKDATDKLVKAMNSAGVDIVKATPAAGQNGIDVPTEKIFDVTVEK